jgi:Mn-containing catalase
MTNTKTKVVINMTKDEFQEMLRDIIHSEFKHLSYLYEEALKSLTVEREKSQMGFGGHVKRFFFHKP